MTALIVVLAAPSGGGKTTIARAVVARRRDVGFSVSATTRAPRPGEQDGEAYFFLSRAEFLRRRDAGEFLESAEYAGELYGTLKAEVERLLRDGRHVLLDIEVQGARQVREQYPPPALVAIFILPPNGRELVRRLRSRRTESAAEIAQRLQTAIWELGQAAGFDHVVINDGLDEAVAKVSSIIDSPFPAVGVGAMSKRIKTLIQELQAEAAQLRTSEEQR